MLGRAPSAYKYKPPSGNAKLSLIGIDTLGSKDNNPSPTITLSLQKTTQLLREYETTSDHPSSGEQVKFARDVLDLNWWAAVLLVATKPYV